MLRAMLRAMPRALLLGLLALPLPGCALLSDPCGDLEERLCADLGPDCATFRGEASIRGSVVPERRRRAERAQCEMFVADENYATYTLPYVQHQIRARRDPTARMPALPRPQPVDGLASGVSSYFFYCLPFLVVPGIFFFSWRARKNLAAAGGVVPPGAAVPVAFGFAHVDSREKAEEQARLGALVAVELLPTWLGGARVPENLAYLTPQAAAQKAALDQQVAAALQQGQSVPYAAEPQYRGSSFVPARLVVRVGEQAHTIDVW